MSRSIPSGLVLLVLVIAIGFLQRIGLFTAVDHPLMLAAGAARGTGSGALLTPVMVWLSIVGDTRGRLILLTLAGLWFWWKGQGRVVLWLIALSVIATVSNEGLKLAFHATRPALIPHLDPIATYSFPSGHASGNMAFFGAVAMIMRRGWVTILCAVLIAAIGISRVWLGVHWPSDVAAGWILGAGLLCLAAPLLSRALSAGSWP